MNFKFLILVTTLTSARPGAGEGPQYCSTEDQGISVLPSTFENLSFDRLAIRKVNRTKVPSHLDHTVIRVSREYRWCRPKILKGEYAECRPTTEIITMDKDDVRKSVERTQCLVGHTCEEYECRGTKSSLCVNPALVIWISPKKSTSYLKATSLLFDTCMQSWECTILPMTSQAYLSSTLQTTLKVPLWGSFVFEPSTEVSRSEATGSYSVLKHPIKVSHDLIEITCISSKHGEEICNDKETGLFFPYSHTITCIEASCYQFTSEVNEVVVDENTNGGRFADQLDLNKLYRITQFQSLQSALNVQTLSSQIVWLEKIISRLILSCDDPLRNSLFSKLFHRNVEAQLSGGDVLKLQVCVDHHEAASRAKDKTKESQKSELFLGKDGDYHLFSDSSLSFTEVPAPSFKIDSLTYQELYDFIENSHQEASADHNLLEEEGTHWGWWHELKGLILMTGSCFGFLLMVFFVGATCCIAWTRIVNGGK